MEFTEEQILLRALSRGDEKAFEVLFMRYFPRVKRFISGLLQDDITAEDFAQDILLKLWQKREEMAKIENLNATFIGLPGMLCTSIYDIYFW
mgnify:CR=1 FL=1